MTTQPPRPRRPLLLLAACVAIVATAVVVLDRISVEEKRRAFAAKPGDPKLLQPPDPLRWRATPFVPGTPAPGFDLVDVWTGARVALDDFHGRPVVLLLSSFGCNVFCSELGRLTDFYERHKGRVAFLFVAIRDAGHPDPATAPPAGAARPGESALDTRLRLVREGAEFYDLPFPTLLDADGEAERAYDAFPKRLVVVGADGRIVYDGGRGAKGGPSDWDLAEVAEHLRSALAQGRAAE